MNVAQDIFRYLRRPLFIRERDKLDRQGVVTLAKIMGLKFLITILGFIAIWIFLSGLGIDRPGSNRDVTKYFDLRSAIFVTVLIPFSEEVISRSWLGRSWGILFIAPLYMALITIMIGNESPEVRPLLYLAITIAWIIYLVNLIKYGWSGEVEKFVYAVFPIVFWFSAGSFALLHLGNFPRNDLGLLSIFLVVPQFIGGAFYGYIRMRFGFLAGFLCHGSWNGILLGLAFVAMLFQ